MKLKRLKRVERVAVKLNFQVALVLRFCVTEVEEVCCVNSAWLDGGLLLILSFVEAAF